MKYLILLILLFTNNSFAQQGYNTAESAVSEIFNPLKQGSKGIINSIKAVDSLKTTDDSDYSFDGKKSKYGKFQDLGEYFYENIKKNGKVSSGKIVEKTARLGGKQQLLVYEVKYFNGEIQRFRINLIKPSDTDGYHVVSLTPDL